VKSIDLRFEEVRARFAQAWDVGSPPRIEEYVEGWTGDERAALVWVLVLLDVAHRRRAGLPVDEADYAARFPGLILPPLSGAAEGRTLSLGPASGPEVATRPGADVVPDGSAPGLLPPGYELLGKLGEGGMGVVYKVRHVRLDRVCALKMILAGGHAGDAERRRFLTEARATARLSHPGIVQVFEVGEYTDPSSGATHPFLALELCPGGGLDRRLREKPPTARGAAETVRALAVAMQAAHDKGVVHRDLKPANVLLAEDGTPKVADFGLARRLDEAGQTHTGHVVGTPSYMPPEQANGARDLGPAVDVYALGAILYECLAGRPPFRGATAMETLLQVLNAEPVAVRQLNPAVPRDLETITHKCLEKDSARRYASAQALADDLGRFLAGEPIVARPVGTLERAVKWVRRNVAVSVLVAAVLLALTAGVIVSAAYARQAGVEATAARKAESAAKDQLHRAEWSVYAGKLLLAQSAFAEGNLPDAFRHLDECQWNLRGWEHRHLRWRFGGSEQTLKGYGGVLSVCFSPDGTRIVTGNWDLTAKVWDAEKGAEILTLKGHANPVRCVRFSPDGKRILTGSVDHTAKVWDADKGTEILTLKGHAQIVESVAWSPDGTRIVTGSLDNTAKVWDAERGAEILTLKGHAHFVESVAWSPDGTRIVTASYDKTAKVWDAEKGAELLTLKGHTEYVTSVCFSPDGTRIATGSGNNTAKVWDAAKGTELLTLKGHTHIVTSVCFSPDGKRILTGSLDETAKVWDANKGTEVQTLKGHTSRVTSVCFSPDGTRIVTGSEDHTARVWDAGKRTELLALKGHSRGVNSVCFSPDGTRIVTGSDDHTARVWDADKGTVIRYLEAHSRDVLSVCFSPDGTRIVTASYDKTAKVWDAEKGAELLTLKGHANSVRCVRFSPDGKRILTGSVDHTAKVWDADKGTELLVLKGHTGLVVSVCFSPDGTRIVTGSRDQTAKVWDADKGTELLVLKGHTASVTGVCFSPDGTRIVTASDDNTAKAWDVDKRTELRALEGHTGLVTGVCFSPDGTRIVTGSDDQTAKVWDADKGAELLALKGHTNTVDSVRFSPDGKRAFAWDHNDKVLAWSIETGQPIPADDPPARPAPGPARSPDGRFRAIPDGKRLLIIDLLQPPPAEGAPWPLPALAERKRHHTEQAALAEKEQKWFAVAFHVGRLLLDDPDNADLKKRRDDALAKHAAKPGP